MEIVTAWRKIEKKRYRKNNTKIEEIKVKTGRRFKETNKNLKDRQNR